MTRDQDSPDIGMYCETCGLSELTWRNTRTRPDWSPRPCVRCADYYRPPTSTSTPTADPQGSERETT